MLHGEKTFTIDGAMHAASLDVLCEFVIKAWDNVKKEGVVRSFKKCGISNAMDGTDGELLHESEDEFEAKVDSHNFESDTYYD